MPGADRKADTRELRLAVVCYGGVSLAIYMHGITKELHKLARASRALNDLGTANVGDDCFRAYSGADTEYAYLEELRDLAERGTRLSVAIDVIAGTSAGGINGACLAKALACDGDQKKLKELWIREGDLKRLIDALPVGGWRTRALFAVMRLVRNPLTTRFPLLGKRMSWLLFDAIRDMQGPAGQSLVPGAGSLDLYVTTTDLHGFNVLVPSGAGGASQRDTDHAQVLHFRYDPGTDNFTGDHTGALAFAARATSCFPGAFPPVSLASFQAELNSDRQQRDLKAELLTPLFVRSYSEQGDRAEDAWFVDGGLLDNAPFDLVVDAIAGKRADNEVIRQLIYIQPDPGPPLRVSPHERKRAQEPREAPGWLPSVWTALTAIKGSQPILRDLFRLRDLNLRISELGAISAAQMEQVLAVLDSPGLAAGSGGTPASSTSWDEMTFDQLAVLAKNLDAAAERLIGAYYPTYCRLKLQAACWTLADEISARFAYPQDSDHQSFVRAVLGVWGQNLHEWSEPDLRAIRARLGPADMPYRERRLLFMLAGINSLYRPGAAGQPPPPAEDVNQLKAKAWDELEYVRSAPKRAADQVGGQLRSFLDASQLGTHVFDSPDLFAAQHAQALTALLDAYGAALGTDLTGHSSQLWADFLRITAGWVGHYPDARRALLSRYVGFPLWDALIFPTIALSELPQYTPIGVSQYSPVAARALVPPGGHKLMGSAWHHFGGFMEASWRENDYLWGRLDGAELIMRTLRAAADPKIPGPTTTRPLDPGSAAEAAGPRLKDALARILAAESDLTLVTELRATLTAQLNDPPWTATRSNAQPAGGVEVRHE